MVWNKKDKKLIVQNVGNISNICQKIFNILKALRGVRFIFFYKPHAKCKRFFQNKLCYSSSLIQIIRNELFQNYRYFIAVL